MKSGFVDVSNGKIYFEAEGNGTPLVLIHEGYVDSRIWDNVVGYLSDRFQVIRYDVRGFGRSSRPTESFSDYLDLKALLDHLEINQVILVGASNGGRIALDFSVEHPEMVKALVLVGSGTKGFESDTDEVVLWGNLGELEEKYLRLRDEGKLREAAAIDVDYWSHKLSGKVRDQVLNIAEENVNPTGDDPDKYQVSPDPPAFNRLDILHMPVLIMIGSEDKRGMKEISKAMQDRIHSSKLVTIEGSDHLPNMSSPENFKETILSFLEDFD